MEWLVFCRRLWNRCCYCYYCHRRDRARLYMLLDDDRLVGNNNIVDNENCRAERVDYLRWRMEIAEAVWFAASSMMRSEKRQLQYYY